MEKEKDNGYVGTQRTETGAEAQMGVGGEKDCPNTVSTGLGKFKDVDALLKAYDCLQAEFTRRSQRLKQLEKAMENSEESKPRDGVTEKLRKNAEKVKQEEEKFDGFIAEIEGANVRALSKDAAIEEPVACTAEEDGAQAQEAERVQNSPKDGESKAVKGEDGRGTFGKEMFVAESRKEPSPSPDELYRLANGNEEVRLKIIGEYLHSVGKTGAPLAKGGGGLLSAPPVKAKTVREAGEMALRWLQRESAR